MATRPTRGPTAVVTILVAAALAGCTGGDGRLDADAPTPSAPVAAAPRPSAVRTPTPAAQPAEPSPGQVPPDGTEVGDPGGADEGATDRAGDGPRPTVSLATHAGGDVEMAGYVAGVVVDDGVCRFELVGGGTTILAESAAFADASVTVCPPVIVTAPPGDPTSWRARLVWVPTGATSAAVEVAAR